MAVMPRLIQPGGGVEVSGRGIKIRLDGRRELHAGSRQATVSKLMRTDPCT